MSLIAMNYAARSAAISFLSGLCAVISLLCWRRFRRSEKPWMYPLVGGYNLIVLATYIVGLVRDDGFGWAFLPMMIVTAPWSFMSLLMRRGSITGCFASGLIGNLVLFVLLCGGLNSLLLYAVFRRVMYPESK